jgi:hypothetical protein
MTPDEEDDGRLLLLPLRGDEGLPPGPSRVDVAAVMATGRRRVRVRRLIGAGCAAAAVLAVAAAVPVAADALRRPGPPVAQPAPATGGPTAAPTGERPAGAAAAPTSCAVDELPPGPGADEATASAVDPSGRHIVGRDYRRGTAFGALTWQDGRPVPVDLSGVDQQLAAVNSAGAAVGSSYLRSVQRAWHYLDGRVTRLGAQTAATALAIGDSGLVAGARMTAPESTSPVPVIWRSPAEAAVDLERPGRRWFGYAVAVAPDDAVVGWLSTKTVETSRGYLWDSTGELTALPLPTVDGRQADGFEPVSAGERWVTGRAFLLDENGFTWRYVRYDRTTGRFAPYPAEIPYARGGNAAGWLVGNVIEPMGMKAAPARDGGPTLFTEAGRLRLPEAAGMREHFPAGVSADGRVIVGQALADGRLKALVWRCR